MIEEWTFLVYLSVPGLEFVYIFPDLWESVASVIYLFCNWNFRLKCSRFLSIKIIGNFPIIYNRPSMLICRLDVHPHNAIIPYNPSPWPIYLSVKSTIPVCYHHSPLRMKNIHQNKQSFATVLLCRYGLTYRTNVWNWLHFSPAFTTFWTQVYHFQKLIMFSAQNCLFVHDHCGCCRDEKV